MKIRLLAVALLVVAAGLGACKKKSDPKSSAKEITAFSVNGVPYTINSGNTITKHYGKVSADVWENGTPAGDAAPTIVHTGVKIEPNPNTPQTFIDKTVIYTVTAEDGSTKQYTVSATKQMTL